MVIRSIRWRLQLWLGFLLVGVLGGFGFAVHQFQGVIQLGQLDEELERRVAALNLAVRGGPGPRDGHRPGRDEGGPPGFRGRPPGPPPDDGGGPRGGRGGPQFGADAAMLFEDSAPVPFHAAVWSRDGTSVRRSVAGPVSLDKPSRPGRDTQIHTRTRDGYRESFQFTELGDCVLAGRSLAGHEAAQRRLAWTLCAAGAAVLALGLGGGWWLTTRALRPVEEIGAAARRISGGNLSERIRTTEPDSEIGRLAGVLNSMFARLESAFVRQRQFTADAAHELRTPLAVLIVDAQSALARERSAAEYRETISAGLATAQQMRRLTESLLQLARLDDDLSRVVAGPFDLATTVEDCAGRIRSLATERGLTLHCELLPAAAHGDAERIGQVAINLLSNAIHYNRAGGGIRVGTALVDGEAVLTVEDTGIGIEPADLPHVFERFYRADRSRSLAEGRSGLGLAICQAIVAAHGGRIAVESRPGIGTKFTVRLPATGHPGRLENPSS